MIMKEPKSGEVMLMNPVSGSVDTLENWISDSENWEGDIQAQLDSLTEVVKDSDGSWIESQII